MTNRSRELKTVSKMISSETAGITLGGRVPTGMKRWVTFITVDPKGVAMTMSDVALYLASVGVSNPSLASIVATGNRKMHVALKATQKSICTKYLPVMVPPSGPDPDNPLFSIAGGKWLGAVASQTTANVFIQYFEE